VAVDLVDKIQAGHHVVQFYERDENLALAVASFLGAGLVADEAVLIVATPEHRAAFEGVMFAAGIDLRAMATAGRYRSLDAAEVLSQFMIDGQPDRGRFTATVGGLVGALSGERPLRIYGEMVALLWDEGNVTAAIALEALWNDLASTHAFALFCAYPLQSVATSPLDHDQICQHHSEVIPEAPTPVSSAGHATQRFEPTRFAASAARRFVTSILQAWDHGELIDAAALVVSELATNAVVHVGHRFTVTLTDRIDTIRIEVTDDSSTGPTVRGDRANRGTNGRGMHLIAAAARQWGTEGHPDGKTVWADLKVTAPLLPD
jgi:anti-sigma regulatory factor (Ser/Thr protein kinase)